MKQMIMPSLMYLKRNGNGPVKEKVHCISSADKERNEQLTECRIKLYDIYNITHISTLTIFLIKIWF